MKERIQNQTCLDIERFPWVLTFHSACYRILRQHCDVLEYKRPLQIWAEYQPKQAMKSVVVERLGFDRKYIKACQSAVSNAKNYGNPTEYIMNHPQVGPVMLHDVFKTYQSLLFAANAVDFDDILLLTREILIKRPDIAKLYRDHFEFVLIDEYQDCNALQVEISDMLIKNGALYAVGDDYQSIYGFRMSNVDFFLNFKKRYPDARIFKLEQNYRSSNEIVGLGNQIIANNAGQMEKECFSEKSGATIESLGFYDENEEAEFAARQIIQLNKSGIEYKDMAILYRTKFCSLAFERALRFRGIPYVMVGSKGFFDRKEILDLNSFLNAACFPKDDASFERIVNTPKRGIGPGLIGKIKAQASEGMSLQDAARAHLDTSLFSPKTRKSMTTVLNLLDEIRDMRPDKALLHVVETVAYMDFLLAYCKGDIEALGYREENIQQLTYMAGQYETTYQYLEEASLVKEDKKSEEDEASGVRLSTVHAAKGLEYKVVFVVGLEEGLFPHDKCMGSIKEIEEERRLFYVACTRAESHLFMTNANFRRGQCSSKSQFLSEIQESLDAACAA
jgi:DNA helicase-2/ATP-dependent DNA helicase PcrA